MKTRRHRAGRVAAWTILLLSIAVPPASAQSEPAPAPEERWGDLISVFGDVHVPQGVRQRGSVVCIGGDVTIEGDVTRDVVVVMGSLALSGHVGNNLAGVISDLELRDARIDRDLVSVLGTVDLERSRIGRELVNVFGTLRQDAPSVSHNLVDLSFGSWFPSIWSLIFWARILSRFLVFVLLLLLVALVPERIRLIAEEAPVRYVPAFFVGLLGYLGLLLALALLSITVIGIPLALLAFWLTKWLAVAGLFAALFGRLGRAGGFQLSLLGSVLLGFGVYVLLVVGPLLAGLPGLLVALPCAALFFLLVEIPAVGLAILTRLGSRGGRLSGLPGVAVAPAPPPLAAPPG